MFEICVFPCSVYLCHVYELFTLRESNNDIEIRPDYCNFATFSWKKKKLSLSKEHGKFTFIFQIHQKYIRFLF